MVPRHRNGGGGRGRLAATTVAAALALAAVIFLGAEDYKWGRMALYELSYVGAEVAPSQRQRKLFVLVTGVQGSGTTMVARVLGHPQWSMAFGGTSHPVLAPELFRDRKELWGIGRTADEVWQVVKRLERRRKLAPNNFLNSSATAAARRSAAAVSDADANAELELLVESHGCEGFDHFEPRVRPEAPGDRAAFVKPLLKRLRWLMDKSHYSTSTGDPRGRSVYVFHKVRARRGGGCAATEYHSNVNQH